MNLFMNGDFTLRSGQKSTFRIECDALAAGDWKGVAAMISELKLLPAFRWPHGVPRGGLPFAAAMEQYATRELAHPALICEDVCTTGGSMERFRAELESTTHAVVAPVGYIGVCLFARGPVPRWVTPVWSLWGTLPVEDHQ